MMKWVVAATLLLTAECFAFSPSSAPLGLRKSEQLSSHPPIRQLRLSNVPAGRTPLLGGRIRGSSALESLMASAEFDTLKDISVTHLSSGESRPVVSSGQAKTFIAFLTHWGDLSSWEYVQQLRLALPDLKAAGIEVMCIGIGGEVAGREFAKENDFPEELLYFDSKADCAAALGFEPGFGRNSAYDEQTSTLSPYLRLLPMLLGIGSPGTLPKVIYGYFGDRSNDPKWTVDHLRRTATGAFPYVDPDTFNTLGEGYLRPFELATVRLQNMIGILKKWNTLIPENQDLVVQQGGTIVMNGEDVVYRSEF
mmetsp:Transcript_49390/g.77180  ORF Transcript_49390/g.77180 Transcript_49390/m.77180 type:complete len:309 (+) Transcript_49390:72-998(+)